MSSGISVKEQMRIDYHWRLACLNWPPAICTALPYPLFGGVYSGVTSLKLSAMMQRIKFTALILILAGFSMVAEASLSTWDFRWERSTGSNTYSGNGMFSFGGAAGNLVTHGGSMLTGNLNDELLAFSFEGLVNNVSIGSTNELPSLFSFSPDGEFILALSANTSGQGAGVGCFLNLCALFNDGDRIRKSGGSITLTQRGHDESGSPTGLSEPGLFGLTIIGLLLSLWFRRQRSRVRV